MQEIDPGSHSVDLEDAYHCATSKVDIPADNDIRLVVEIVLYYH